MAANKTTLKKGDNLRARGKSFKTLLMEVIKQESMIGITPKSTKEDADKAFIKHVAKRAFAGDEDQNSGMLLKELLTKSYPSLKPTLEKFEFEFNADGTDLEKASSILKAISSGVLPPDVGQLIVGVIKDNSIIEANTDLKDRIIKLEAALNGEP